MEALHAVEHAPVDSNSDIEMTLIPPDIHESHPPVLPVQHTLEPIESPVHTAVYSTAAPAPAAEEIEREELLPKRPLSPAQLQAEHVRLEAEAAVAAAAAEKERIALEQGKKPKKKRAKKDKPAPKAPPATDRTTEGLEWTPPPPPAPFKRYRCEYYDACRIIHPGSGHDPYWDMPQLIAQVSFIPNS
jgi:hypothetical protein